jgi:hypothetical protein
MHHNRRCQPKAHSYIRALITFVSSFHRGLLAGKYHKERNAYFFILKAYGSKKEIRTLDLIIICPRAHGGPAMSAGAPFFIYSGPYFLSGPGWASSARPVRYIRALITFVSSFRALASLQIAGRKRQGHSRVP